MRNPDPVVPRLDTSGTRAPPRGDPPRTLVGALATVGLLLAVLFVPAAPPALLVGLLFGVAFGAVVAVVSCRRETDASTQICVPRAGICVQL